jgi:nucleotide-binding universal stress UspA family protein
VAERPFGSRPRGRTIVGDAIVGDRRRGLSRRHDGPRSGHGRDTASEELVMGRIVVGVDGSEGSRDALRWAAAQAKLTGAPLEVVHTYEHEPAWAPYAYDATMSRDVWEKARQEVEAAVRQAAVYAQAIVDDMVRDLDGVEVQAVTVESRHPAQALVDRSRGADLLVVGSRGRGGFKRLLLGSVSQQCAHHAECPVVIIRSPAGSPD